MADIDILVDQTVKFLDESSTSFTELDQTKIERNNKLNIWSKLTLFIYGFFSYNLLLAVFKRWSRDSYSYRTRVVRRLERKLKRNVCYVSFSLSEWRKVLKRVSGVGNRRRGFLVSFTNLLSFKLQALGIKCWLCNSSSYNYFGKLNSRQRTRFWSGRYKCMQTGCSCVFKASIRRQPNGREPVFVKVKLLGSCSHVDKLSKVISCQGRTRRHLSQKLQSLGLGNAQADIILTNPLKKPGERIA